MTPLIKAEDLCKVYDNEGVKTEALCGVSFRIDPGEFVAIMGPSGSGKSTLMQMLGLLDRPTSGSFYFRGQAVKDFTDDELAYLRNKEIGFVFQTFNLLPRISVFENVEIPLLYNQQKESRESIKKRVAKALESVGMAHRAGYRSNQLSGGEQQRVAIARALVMDPEIVFADEPTGNLDSKSGVQIMKILQNLNEIGRTVVLVTHETFTAQHAKRMIQMKDGKIISDSPITERRVAKDGELIK